MKLFRKTSVAAVAALVPVGLALAAEAVDDEPAATVELADPAPMFADQFASAFTPGAVESLDVHAGAVTFTQPPKITEAAGE